MTAATKTATVRVWRGRHDLHGDPDETHTLPVHEGFRHDAETVVLADSIRDAGWMAFDVTDLPADMETVQLNVHADDSFHDPQPLAEAAVERGLVFDGDYKPAEKPPCYYLTGIVECFLGVPR